MNALLIINEADYKLQHSQIAIGEYEDIVNQLVDVEPIRHGHWKYLGITGDRYHYSCSECGYIMYGEKYPYCGNCGAKMDEVTE